MADPICRWRNPYLATVTELIELLPKLELPKETAREIINEQFGGDFFHTAYQLACQLGLYHETAGYYFPKFKYNPTEEEILNYLKNWVKQYCIPNPYTRGFNNIIPFSIHSELCNRLWQTRNSIEWDEIETEIFGEEIGNHDILVNSINTYSDIIQITNNQLSLKEGISYDSLVNNLIVDISIDRNNKEFFFDLFLTPNELQENNNLNNLAQETDIDQSEKELIKEIKSSNTLSRTEKEQLVKSRIGQGLFRRNLIEECKLCPITGVNDIQLLIASHIKPWKHSNNSERLDVYNGLLLTPTFDKLFDRGLISFTNNKRLIISPIISQTNCENLSLNSNQYYPNIPIIGRENYLEFHRNEILIQ